MMMITILPVREYVDPEFIEPRSIHFRYNVDGFSGGVDLLGQPSVFFFEQQRKFFHLDPLIPSKRDGTGQWIMLEIDDIVRQSFAGFSKSYFVLLVYCEGLRLLRN